MISPKEHLYPYNGLYQYQSIEGYIVWRYGTGETVELLQLEASEHRKGYGTFLVKHMLSELSDHPSHYTVYGFTRERLIIAQIFYLSLGFKLIRLPDYYREGSGVLFSQKLSTLLERQK